MQFTLNGRTAALSALSALLAFVALCGTQSPARAEDSAYISQINAGAGAIIRLSNTVAPLLTKFTPSVSTPTSYRPTPQVASSTLRGNNIAATLEIGSYNQAFTIQAGVNDTSTIGILGNHNTVGVLQAGNNLRSNLVLLNTNGFSVGVIQPNGSAPVNMLIARLPNGALLIKR